MKIVDLFSGIGGISIGLEAAGMETVAFCEIEDYPVKVLNRHWPDVPVSRDVTKLTYDLSTRELKHDGQTIYSGSVELLCGGFPCQDLSTAGRQGGIDAERSGLWSECARLIGEIQPRVALFENVTNLLNGGGGDWFKRVLGDISALGYDAEWHCIPASDLGAHHHRDRIWILAYPNKTFTEGRSLSGRIHKELSDAYGRSRDRGACDNVADASQIGRDDGGDHRKGRSGQNDSVRAASKDNKERNGRKHGASPDGEVFPNTDQGGREGPGEYIEPEYPEAVKDWEAGRAVRGCVGSLWQAEPRVGRVVDGVSAQPHKSNGHRLAALGNAVVPQIPEIIGRAIMEELASEQL